MDARAPRMRSNWHYLFGVLGFVGAPALVFLGPLLWPQSCCDALSSYMRCGDGAVARCAVESSAGQRARSHSADVRARCSDGSTLSVAPLYLAGIPLGVLGVALGIALVARGYRIRTAGVGASAVRGWARPRR